MGEMERIQRANMEYIWARQETFNKHFQNLGHLSQAEKESLTKDFILYIHGELTELVQNLSWKTHRREGSNIVRGNVIEEIIDIFKYWNGLALIWDLGPEEFLKAWERKTEVVEQKYEQEFMNPWDPKKYKYCAVVDIDGVLADYFKGVFGFIKEKTGHDIPMITTGEFYAHVGKYIGHEKAYELKHVFRETGIESQGLEPIEGSLKFMNWLKEDGAYILLMTARPYKKYKRIMADTIGWLKRYGYPYHSILFDENKEDRIIKEYSFAKFVVEDTFANAVRIASKGIKVYLRNTSYNEGEKEGLDISRFSTFDRLIGTLIYEDEKKTGSSSQG